MRRILQLLIILPVLFSMVVEQASGQCTPSLSSCHLKLPTDPICMVPDTNEMPPALVNQPYDRTIHFIFENSITVTSNPQTGQQLPFPVTALLQYMVFDSLGGLPPGITYQMYSGNPQDPPGKFSPANGNKAFGCIYLQGLPTQTNTSATNGAIIYMKPHGCVLGGALCGDFPWQITYKVPIVETIGMPSIIMEKEMTVAPQSLLEKIQVDFQATTGCLSEFIIIDLTVRTMLNIPVVITEGQNKVFLHFSEAAGFYILQVKTPYGISAKSFVW